MKKCFYPFLAANFILALAAFSPAGKPKLRMDGLYMSDLIISGEDTSRSYIRFFPGKVVCAVTSGPNPEDIKRWFKPDSLQAAYKGTYTLKASAISFSVGQPGKTVDYEGKLSGNQLDLKWKSNINGREGRRNYKYYKFKKK